MAIAQFAEMDPQDLKESDRAILDALTDGRATKGALVEWTDYSRNSIYHRLEVLQAAGLVECVHEGTRLFELVEDPRESDDRDENLKSDGVGRVQTDPIDAALAGWRPGRGPDDRKKRLASARELLEYLRDQDSPTQRSEIEQEIGDDLMLDSQSEFVDGFWKKVGLPAIRRARDTDIIELEGNSYRWVRR